MNPGPPKNIVSVMVSALRRVEIRFVISGI